MPIERELKFSTTDEHVPSLAELRLALGSSSLELSPAEFTRHVDVYYDDENGGLRRAGWALRRRRSADSTIVTLKSENQRAESQQLGGQQEQAAPMTGALHSRREIEVELSAIDDETMAGGWPAEVVAAMPQWIDKTALRQEVELRVRRVATVAVRAGTPVAELAFDEVVCALPGTTDSGTPLRDTPHFTFYEVEIEALTGQAGDGSDHAALTELAEAVTNLLPLTTSTTSKFERSITLLGPFLEDRSGGE